MKKTKVIGILIIILVILLTIVLFFITDLTLLNTTSNDEYVNTTNNIEKNNVQNEVTSNTVSNENSTNNTVNSNTNSTNSSNDSTTNDVFYNKEETGNTKYSENQLDNVSIEINGITEDISKHIKNQSEFIKAIKEYIYKNGLVDATAMEVQKYEYQENTDRLGIIFVLNNTNENKLRVIVNANGKIDISDYN
jgi:hypothetical protein